MVSSHRSKARSRAAITCHIFCLSLLLLTRLTPLSCSMGSLDYKTKIFAPHWFSPADLVASLHRHVFTSWSFWCSDWLIVKFLFSRIQERIADYIPSRGLQYWQIQHFVRSIHGLLDSNSFTPVSCKASRSQSAICARSLWLMASKWAEPEKIWSGSCVSARQIIQYLCEAPDIQVWRSTSWWRSSGFCRQLDGAWGGGQQEETWRVIVSRLMVRYLQVRQA